MLRLHYIFTEITPNKNNRLNYCFSKLFTISCAELNSVDKTTVHPSIRIHYNGGRASLINPTENGMLYISSKKLQVRGTLRIDSKSGLHF